MELSGRQYHRAGQITRLPVLLCGLRGLCVPRLAVVDSQCVVGRGIAFFASRGRPAATCTSAIFHCSSNRAFTAAASAVRPCFEARLQARQRPAVVGKLLHVVAKRRLGLLRAPELEQRRALQLTDRNRPVGRLHVGEAVLERDRLREVPRRLIGAALPRLRSRPTSTSCAMATIDDGEVDARDAERLQRRIVLQPPRPPRARSPPPRACPCAACARPRAACHIAAMNGRSSGGAGSASTSSHMPKRIFV